MKRIGIIAGVIGVIAIGVFFLVQWTTGSTSAETLTEQEARQSVLNRYAGEIVQIDLREGRYEVELELETGLYEIHVDAQTGDVLSLVRKEEYPQAAVPEDTLDAVPPKTDPSSPEEPLPPEPEKGNEPPQKPDTPQATPDPEEPKPPRLISKEDAARIAKEHTPGEVDDVDFKQMDGVGFYLVEIELDDDREVYVQIHAITGEVMSVSWDDDAWDD